MLLDLFITHWTEAWEIGKNAFQMLAAQIGVDWTKVRVTLVHDGSEEFPAEYFAGFPFEVNQVALTHRGIAAVRNWCIEHSNADFIKFNDFDDTFANVFALKSILDVLKKDDGRFDLIWFDLLWYMDGRVYLRTERNPVFIHDKIFRRRFLEEHGIRFNESLTWCEDSAFLAIVEMEINTQRIGKIKCDSPIYLYICRQGSLCNRPEIKFQNLQSFFDRHCYVAEEFLKRGMMDPYYTMCVRIMADSYYTLVRAPGITEDKSEHEKRVFDWYRNHKEAFNACRPEMIPEVMTAVNKEDFDGGYITFDQVIAWIREHERSVA